MLSSIIKYAFPLALGTALTTSPPARGGTYTFATLDVPGAGSYRSLRN